VGVEELSGGIGAIDLEDTSGLENFLIRPRS
jgi:hypothetical protein